MALPQTPAWPFLAPDPTAQRRDAAHARKLHAARRRADDSKKERASATTPATAVHTPVRANSLRRVHDSREHLLRTTRTRGSTSTTADSTTPSTAPGRSFTVANINHGIIYLRCVAARAHSHSRAAALLPC